MLRSLVGSEMCIRDSSSSARSPSASANASSPAASGSTSIASCLLYTSDAADEEDSVVLCGGRFFQAEDGIRDAQESRGLGDVYKRQQFERPVTVGECQRQQPGGLRIHLDRI